MNGSKKSISIKSITTIVFVASMLISIFGIGFLVFSRWLHSAEQSAKSISADISGHIYQQIDSFIKVPNHVNEMNFNIIQNGMLDLSNEKQRDKYFVGILKSNSDQIYSVSYGTANGEYYGARRNEHGAIEIMKNNADTQGNSWYYSVNSDFTAGELVVKAGKFDPRIRAWYQAAQKAGGHTLSPVYKHFVMNDLTISAAWPIYDGNGTLQGVLGTHLLLSGIGTYLQNAIQEYSGYAVIVEQHTGALIANSMGTDNFSVLSDGTLKRYDITRIQNMDIQKAYAQYAADHDARFIYKGENEKLYVNTQEIHMEGIDWVVICAIPEGLFLANVFNSIRLTLLLVGLAMLLSILVFCMVSRRLLNPMSSLLQVSGALSAGDLSKRVEVDRNDEIGMISGSLNRVADKMQYLIANLETNVGERTEELHRANMTLEENRDQLQLILDSAAEAIFGIDLNDECTFCNASCLRLLGYKSPEDLLGKNMHGQIHYNHRDGSAFPVEECKIFQSIKQGKGFEAEDEVFWKADGSPFDVEYHSYPQIKNGKVLGGVVTFMDITDRRQREERIRFLSCYDTLTGLHNRRCLEDNRTKIDIPDNLPLSVIFADINGLKMTNDVFGHAAGDELLRKSAEILKHSCRDTDVIARVGGDEFIVLLPKTNEENAEKVLSRIKAGFVDARVEAIKCSISLGYCIKNSVEVPIEEIITCAENAMYNDKAKNRIIVNKDIINTVLETLHSRSPREMQHSRVVSELCGDVGLALHLSEPEISKLKRTGYMHDIGKITLDVGILVKESLTEEEKEKMSQHPVVGYRILNLFDDTMDLAEFVYSHHERWDGSGYPRGLKGEQIPLISRIVSIVGGYERVANGAEDSAEQRKTKAIEKVKRRAGTQYDPKLVQLFVKMLEKKSK